MAYKLCMKNVNKFNFDIGNPLPLGWVGPLFWDKVLEKSLIRNSCCSVSKKPNQLVLIIIVFRLELELAGD